MVGEGAHALAHAGRQDHGLHPAATPVLAGDQRRQPLLEPALELRHCRLLPGVRRGDLPHVVDHQRQVLQVGGLAVAQVQARKGAQYLDMPLQAHEVEPAQEAVGLDGPGQAAGLQPLSISQRPLLHLRRGPADITVPQQGHQVVADRAQHRVLEVDDAEAAVGLRHQVAAVKIPVHQHARLLQGTGDKHCAVCLQQALFVSAQ